MAINLKDAIKPIHEKKKLYLRYKFPNDIDFDVIRMPKNDEELMEMTGYKTMNPFLKFEKTSEYKAIVNLILYNRTIDDLMEIYETVSKNAKEKGDPKDVKLFLDLAKEIKKNTKQAEKILKNEIDVEDEKENAKDEFVLEI